MAQVHFEEIIKIKLLILIFVLNVEASRKHSLRHWYIKPKTGNNPGFPGRMGSLTVSPFSHQTDNKIQGILSIHKYIIQLK